MAVQEMQARVKAKVWEAIAQSDVDVSAIPQAEMDKLVMVITDTVLVEMDEMLDEISGQAGTERTPATEEVDEGEAAEQVLWRGRPFLSINTHYTITSERIRVVKGLMGKEREDIELVRVQDIDQTQSGGERMLNVGDIHILSHDPSTPEMVLNNVSNPYEVHEILRRAVLEARKRHNLHYREEM